MNSFQIIVRATKHSNALSAWESRTLKPIVRQAHYKNLTSRLCLPKFFSEKLRKAGSKNKFYGELVESIMVSSSNLFWLLVIISVIFFGCFNASIVYAKVVLDLTVDKTEAQPGDLLTYAIHCRNQGTKAVYDLKLKHYLPQAVTVQGASFPLTYLGGHELNFDLGKKLQSQDGKIITVQVKITEQPISGSLMSKAILEYKEKQGGTNLVVFDTAETLLKLELPSTFQRSLSVISLAEDTPWYSVPLAKYRSALVPTVQAAEIKVGSSWLTNLILACLIATLAVGLLLGFDKLRKLIKIKS